MVLVRINSIHRGLRLAKFHTSFIEPDSRDLILWRFMSLDKFTSMIQQKSLILSNLELMIAGDPYEGMLPKSSYLHRKWRNLHDCPTEARNNVRAKMKSEGKNELAAIKELQLAKETHINSSFLYRKFYFVCCWHQNQSESAAMWDLYSNREAGVSIVTDVKTLMDALPGLYMLDSALPHQDIYCGLVRYMDYDDPNFEIRATNMFDLVAHKRLSYQHEKEFRLIYQAGDALYELISTETEPKTNQKKPRGIHHTVRPRSPAELQKLKPNPVMAIPCDLSKLIHKVMVAPSAPHWFFEIIKDLMKTYKIDAQLEKSRLLEYGGDL